MVNVKEGPCKGWVHMHCLFPGCPHFPPFLHLSKHALICCCCCCCCCCCPSSSSSSSMNCKLPFLFPLFFKHYRNRDTISELFSVVSFVFFIFDSCFLSPLFITLLWFSSGGSLIILPEAHFLLLLSFWGLLCFFLSLSPSA